MNASPFRNCVCPERNRIGGARKKWGGQRPRGLTARCALLLFPYMPPTVDHLLLYGGKFMRRRRFWKRGSERRGSFLGSTLSIMRMYVRSS